MSPTQPCPRLLKNDSHAPYKKEDFPTRRILLQVEYIINEIFIIHDIYKGHSKKRMIMVCGLNRRSAREIQMRLLDEQADRKCYARLGRDGTRKES